MTTNSIREAVAEWISKLPINTEFTSVELFRAMKRAGIKNTSQTIIRRMYECREDKFGYGWYPVCISGDKSLYRKMTVKDAHKFLKPKRVLM